MNQELRRKQIEEILLKKRECKDAPYPDCDCGANPSCQAIDLTAELLALLSDAERKGAWAVAQSVEEAGKRKIDEQRDRVANETRMDVRDNMDYYLGGMTDIRDEKDRAARQVASSFGPDPEGEKKES